MYEHGAFDSGSDEENSNTALPWSAAFPRGRGGRLTPAIRRHLVKTRSAGVIRLTTTTCNGDWAEKRAPVVRPHTSDGRRRSLPTSGPSTSVVGTLADTNNRGESSSQIRYAQTGRMYDGHAGTRNNRDINRITVERKPEDSSRKTVKWDDMCRPKTAPNGIGLLWKDVGEATDGISETIGEVATPPSSDDDSSSQESSSSSPSPRDFHPPNLDVDKAPASRNQGPGVDTEDAPLDTRRLPQWKRDLMIEAPPSVYTSREPVKVAVVMSKSQRQRELDQLVEVNVSDVKALAIRERVRKMRARMNVSNTVDTIQHVIAALKETVDRQ